MAEGSSQTLSLPSRSCAWEKMPSAYQGAAGVSTEEKTFMETRGDPVFSSYPRPPSTPSPMVDSLVLSREAQDELSAAPSERTRRESQRVNGAQAAEDAALASSLPGSRPPAWAKLPSGFKGAAGAASNSKNYSLDRRSVLQEPRPQSPVRVADDAAGLTSEQIAERKKPIGKHGSGESHPEIVASLAADAIYAGTTPTRVRVYDIAELHPRAFDGAAGLTSHEAHRARDYNKFLLQASAPAEVPPPVVEDDSSPKHPYVYLSTRSASHTQPDATGSDASPALFNRSAGVSLAGLGSSDGAMTSSSDLPMWAWRSKHSQRDSPDGWYGVRSPQALNNLRRKQPSASVASPSSLSPRRSVAALISPRRSSPRQHMSYTTEAQRMALIEAAARASGNALGATPRPSSPRLQSPRHGGSAAEHKTADAVECAKGEVRMLSPRPSAPGSRAGSPSRERPLSPGYGWWYESAKRERSPSDARPVSSPPSGAQLITPRGVQAENSLFEKEMFGTGSLKLQLQG